MNVDTNRTLYAGNIGQLVGAGKSLDSLLNDFQPPPAVGGTS